MKIGKYELNKIYNENCYESIKEIPDKSINIIYTDIPYIVKTGGGNKNKDDSSLNKRIKKEIIQDLNGITNGIDYKILDEFVRIQPYIYIYIWCSKDQIYDIMKFYIEKHKCRFNLLVWCKTNPTPGTNNTWLPNLEYCLVFKDENAPKYNDGYEKKSKWYISPKNKSDKDTYNHPTIKMIEQVKQHISHSARKGDVVLDPFCGSGTTLVASKELGIDYIGFEINEKYYKIACDRLNGITATGQTSIFTDFENLGE